MPTRISRLCEGIMEAAWLAAMILVPVFFNVYSSRIFEPDKIAILRSLALVIFVAWLVRLVDSGLTQLENGQTRQRDFSSIWRIPLVVLVAAFALVYLIATVFSVTQRVSLWGSYQRLQGTYTVFSYLVVFAAMLGNLRRREQVERLLTTIIISSLPVSLYGFLQRYQIDPIPWGGDVSRRIAANMGNSIFVAAYLIMVFPLTVGRIIDAHRRIWQETGHISGHVARATVYIFTAAVQLIAIYMSGSRGPMLGLLAGVFILLLLLSWQGGQRRLTTLILGLAAVGAVFLGVFNISGGPLESLRSSPAIGRFGLLLDAESNSALVRRYIWEGTVRLVTPHQPLVYPDGRKDIFNSLRPIIGYGPESMYVAFNPFYVPELGQVEKRNASPDRAHNETWDALVITGALGLVVYLAIFVSIFYYGLTWIGLLRERRHQVLFLLLCLLGAGAGSLFLSLWRGVEYSALGLPLGLVSGLIVYIVYSLYTQPFPVLRSEGEITRSFTLIVLTVAIISHFLEINFGIAIAVTRTYFWVYSALLILVGYILPRVDAGMEVSYRESLEVKQNPQIDSGASSSKGEHRLGRPKRQRKGERGSRYSDRDISIERKLPVWLQFALPEGGIASLLMIVLGFDYILNSSRMTSIPSIIWNAFTRLPNQQNAFSPGILMLVLTTWLTAGIVLATEKTKCESRPNWVRALWSILALSGGLAILFWIWHAGTLASLVRYMPENVEQLKIQVGRISSLLTNFYLYSFLIIFGLAYSLTKDWPARRNGFSSVSILVGLILAIASFWIIYFTNVRVIQADIAFKMAEPFNRPGQWSIATELYRYTNSLAPDQDHYYLFLGRSYLEQAKAEQNPERLDALVTEAEQELKIAQRKNPLNTDHTANLGRLYSWWASRSNDPEIRQDRGNTASRYYELAVSMSPQNSTLWGEWAILYLDVLDQPEEAYKRLERALQLDTRYNWTQGLMGEYYFRMGKIAADAVSRRQALEKALVHYTQALEVSKPAEDQAKIGYLAAIGNVYIELEQYSEAIAAYEEAIRLGSSSTNLWRIEEALARTYLIIGDKENALKHANAALAVAPEDQAERIGQLISDINGVEQE